MPFGFIFIFFFFFFNDTATTEIYTLSLHDALPILRGDVAPARGVPTLPVDEDRGPTCGERAMQIRAQRLLFATYLDRLWHQVLATAAVRERDSTSRIAGTVAKATATDTTVPIPEATRSAGAAADAVAEASVAMRSIAPSATPRSLGCVPSATSVVAAT